MPRQVALCPRQPARRRRPLKETTRKRTSLSSGARLAMDETTKLFYHPTFCITIHIHLEAALSMHGQTRHRKADVYFRLNHDIGQKDLSTGHSIHSVDNRNILSRRHLRSPSSSISTKGPFIRNVLTVDAPVLQASILG